MTRQIQNESLFLQFVYLPANFEREYFLLTMKAGKLFILDIAIHMQLSGIEMLTENSLCNKDIARAIYLESLETLCINNISIMSNLIKIRSLSMKIKLH